MFCLLSVEGSYVLDSLITAFVMVVFACTMSGSEYILDVRLGVFRALGGFTIIAAS